MNNTNNTALLLGRFGLALIFVVSGWGKIGGYDATQGYMAAMGVPGGLLPLVIAAELLGGAAILAGFLTRWAALGLAVFTVLAGVLFHADIADQNQFIALMKNIAIAGGFLALYASGPGAFSVDAWLARKRPVAGRQLAH
jgi:putative oxidoreductase